MSNRVLPSSPGHGPGLTPVRYALCLLLWVLAAYHSLWTTTDFAYHDDYNLLLNAELHDGAIVGQCTTIARPLYGVLNELGFSLAGSLEGLAAYRFVGLLLLALWGLGFAGVLARAGWRRELAQIGGGLVVLLPASQVLVSWAATIPYVLAHLLALLAFVLAQPTKSVRRAVWIRRSLAAVLLLAASFLIYQPAPLAYLLGFAALFLGRRGWEGRGFALYLGRHVGVMVAGVVCALVAFQLILFATGWSASDRLGLTMQWSDKLAWFWDQPLGRAMSLFWLTYHFEEGWLLNNAVAEWFRRGLLALILVGLVVEARSRSGLSRWLLLPVALLLLPASAILLLVVPENQDAYRVLLPVSSMALLLALFAAQRLLAPLGRRAELGVAGAALALAWTLAAYHVEHLIVFPQRTEFHFAREVVRGHAFSDSQEQWYVIRARWGDQPAENWDGEFGCPTLLSRDGTPFLFFYAARERFPAVTWEDRPMAIDQGYDPPTDPEAYARVVDARVLGFRRAPKN
ncbi:MAG: glucosyltransferase domain-containing protein [Opitutales bacterium]